MKETQISMKLCCLLALYFNEDRLQLVTYINKKWHQK